MKKSMIVTGDTSRTQIDKLGNRLRDSTASNDDYLLLALYRDSFGPAYRQVVELVQRSVKAPVTGRPGKTTPSIIAKLRRFRTRLSQMQDVAGCRLVVEDGLAQERALAWLETAFPKATVVDRRAEASFGYRAIHIIPSVSGKPVEIQLRTKLQHLWAELSESLAFRMFIGLKYGDPVPDVAHLPVSARMIRQFMLGSTISEADRARIATSFDDPEFVRRTLERMPTEVTAHFEEVREAIVMIQGALLEASDSIRSVETLAPGLEATKARRGLEKQIQSLISSEGTR
jgi:putative GTP pyrophosphokinase